MIQCGYCTRRFSVTPHGYAEKTFHEILHGTELVNK